MFSRERKTPIAEWWWTIDKSLLAALILLLLVGVLLSFAASPPVAERLGLGPWHFIIRQAIFAALALPVMIATSFLPRRPARLLALAVLVGSTILLWLTLVLGVEVKGATRWVSIAGNTVQPSEFVKPAYAVIGAWLFAESMKRPGVPARSIAFLLMLVIVAGLLLQPDIGQTALVLATWGALLFLSGISWVVIFGLGATAVGLLFAAYAFFPHFAKRIDTFLNPEGGGNTYQVDKALGSLLEGGWFGRGPGESMANKIIPDAHADYVFSAAAGEFGILFCLCLVALIGFIVIKALIGAQQQQSLFARLAASTLAIQFGLQCSINLAVNLSLMPPKGMTLPFVSYGGTSMLAIAFGMGLMLALTRKKPEERLASGLPVYRSGVLSPAE
ncbi:putative peptidoglycan glycosyltransferase FtsW [Devosia sp. ZB163]|uniref:FtsW/RodA/SpoVE family cell cycle protein n=1 Tax=Devosia sp. ZB163 TaxID=3025938 RepID=UPI002361E44C|nr:putative peptidoglycan glycosyltransferase FtsW [Devosia sp. ZB163]MDC9825930.1 putative peptidoglycan glycosyltransferase FtsW [Devosia sp. ZB163]